MQDIFNLPTIDENNQIFYALGSTVWQVWSKPKGAKFVRIFAINGGGAGAGGQGGIGTNRVGGFAGNSSSINSIIYPAFLIPDILYVQVGVGGVGGAGGTSTNAVAGTNGGISYVSIFQNNTAINLLINGGGTAAGGPANIFGAGGSGPNGFGGGNLSNLGLLTASSANAFGVQGGVNNYTAGGNATLAAMVSGGGSGGSATLAGVASNGGNIIGAGIVPTILGGTANATGGTINGQDGYRIQLPSSNLSIRQPIYFTGGAGGGSASNAGGTGGVGGTGGNGAFGCGGGGGGAGDSIGGNGGNGGDGLIIITTW